MKEDFDYDKIIICNNCKAVNKGERYCHSCGNDLLENKVQESEKEAVEYTNASNSSNIVANKFTTVVKIIKMVGYICAILMGILLIIFMNSIGCKFLISLIVGIIVGLISALMVWLSTLVFEFFAETLNLLQDIKNNL